MEILNLINFFFDFGKALFNNAIKNCLESNTELCRQIKISNIKMCPNTLNKHLCFPFKPK